MDCLTKSNVGALLVLYSVGFVCGAVTWVNPTPLGVLTPAVDEDRTGGLGVTMQATVTTAPSTNAITIIQQDVDGMFTLDSNYELELASGSLDYETANLYNFTLQAIDNDDSTTSTITCTLSITDVNESPSFNKTDNSFAVSDGSGAGTAVATLTATDPDSDATGNVVSYAITAGDDNNMFEVSSAGAITVASGKTLSASTSSAYILTLKATSSGLNSPTTTTIVRIAVCANGASMTPSSIGSVLMAGLFLGLRLFNIC